MKRLTKLWLAGIGALTIGLAVSHVCGAPLGEDVNGAVNSVADLLAKGDKDGAKKAAAEVGKKAKGDVEDVMFAFKLRTKKGIGVGNKAGVAMPDGIELKIEAMARDQMTPAALKNEAEALTRASHVMGAVGLSIETMKPPTKQEKMKEWVQWSKDLVKASEDFSGAIKGGAPAAVKKAADKVNQTCNTCHMVFK
jgi:hypothetical protein